MLERLAVEIRGTGVAASCCQQLLTAAGASVYLDLSHRPRVPAVMLSPATQTLLTDVWGRLDLLDGLWQIRRRIVAWGDAPPVDLPHRAIVVSEMELLSRLQNPSDPNPAPQPAWTIHTSRALETSTLHAFGNRTAAATEVRFSSRADAAACLVESVPSGWLFLLPVNSQAAWLLTAGAATEALLRESRLVAQSVDAVVSTGGGFPSHPRIADPLCGPNWFACGSAALGFDPLCGDGTGHAIREAILACAIIRASSPNLDDLLWEYRLRLRAGLQRHLEQCLQFYSTGGSSDWWQTEAQSLRDGLDWLSRQPAPRPLGRFRLNGFDLQRVDAA